MKVWLFNTAEPLPKPGENPRLLRTGLLAKELVRRGHEITWWSSNFDHFSKSYRGSESERVEISPTFTLRLVPTLEYRRNVSLKRLISHAAYAKSLNNLISTENAPDIILSSMPNIDTCDVATRAGVRWNIPVLLDLRDMWPDIFLDVFPPALRSLGRIAITPMSRRLSRACRAAAGIIGITEGFVSWGLKYAGRDRGRGDAHFPHAYPASQPDQSTLPEAEKYWDSFGLSPTALVVSFVGTIRPRNDLSTIVEAARILGNKVVFVLGGSGEQLAKLRKDAAGLNNVILPGWLNHPQINVLLRRSHLAIAPYRNTPDYVMSIPNKPIEYLSAGLPIVSCLSGELERMIIQNNLGAMYREGDAHSLASAITCLSDGALRDSIKRRALSLYQEKFTAERVYADYASHLENVVALRPLNSIENLGRFKCLRAEGV